jgi:hypothetical protein
VGFPEGGNDEYSTYLHLFVNWLEIEASSRCVGRKRTEEVACDKHYYRWMYRTVLSDWRPLEELFRAHDIVPIKPVHAVAIYVAVRLNVPQVIAAVKRNPAKSGR